MQLSDRLSEEIWPNLRRRALAHWLFLASVALPTLLSAVYFGFVASDVFISESRFLVRSPSKDSISTIGGSFGSFIGKMGLDNSENDSHTAENFILSRDALIVLNDKLGIKAEYSSERVDIFRRFAGLKFWDKSFESFYDYYASQVVSISYDRDSGITALSVRAFDPSLARRINQELNLLSEALINRLNTRARQDMLNFARSEVLLAKTKVEETNRKLHLFRTEKQNGSPSQNVALYQQLVNEKDFADRNLAAALASLEQARVEALKKQLYLERVAEPSEPDWPAEPKRIRGVATTFAMGLLVWGLASMIIAGVREHQEHA